MSVYVMLVQESFIISGKFMLRLGQVRKGEVGYIRLGHVMME